MCPEVSELPHAFVDQVQQSLTSMRIMLGSFDPNLGASLCRGEVVYGEAGFVGVEIKKVSAEGGRDGLRWALSSPGAILRVHRILRGRFLVGF